MKTALYVRTSTQYQSKGLEAQKRTLITFCKDTNRTNFSIYSDEGVSGSKSNRLGLNNLMEDAKNRVINEVIVYSFSRFARSTQHLLSALNEFNNLNMSFISLSEQVDTNTAIGKALFTIISAISELERELIRERVQNGLLNAKAKGKVLGRPKQRNSELIQTLLKQGLTYKEISKLAKVSDWGIAQEAKIIKNLENQKTDNSKN